MSNSNFALFLDRDGVINYDYGYVHDCGEFDFVEGVFDLCATASKKGYKIIVVTNQAGIARGYFSESEFLDLTNWMKSQFAGKNIFIDAVYYCPFHPEGGGVYKSESFLRKPNPGMLLKAASDFDLDMGRSVLIGDKMSDIVAGQRAGVGRNILFSPSRGKRYFDSETSSQTFFDSLTDISSEL